MSGFALLLLLAGPLAPQKDVSELTAPRPPDLEIEVVDEAGRRLRGAVLRWVRGDHGRYGRPRPEDVASGLTRGESILPHDVDSRLRDRPLVLAPGGRARIPGATAPGTLVAGEHEGRWGFRWFAADEERGDAPARLVLVPDQRLRIVVQDDLGRPLDGAALSVMIHPYSLGAEVRDGELVLEHASWWLHRSHEPARVVLRGLFDPPVEVRFDPHGPVPDPIVLRAPPHGAVEVRLTERDGRTPLDGEGMFLSLADEDPHDRVRASAPSARAPMRDGVARFPLVRLGRRLVVEVRGEKHVIEGPIVPGETVTTALELAPRRTQDDRPTVVPPLASAPPASARGRVLLDPEIPPGSVKIMLGTTSTPDGMLFQSATPSGAGSFELRDVPPGPVHLEIWAACVRSASTPEPSALFRTDLYLAPGENVIPALQDVDLRGKLFTHRILIEGGTPPGFTARLWAGPAGTRLPKRFYQSVWFRPIVLVSPCPSIDVDLYVPGRHVVTLRGVTDVATARLEPGLPVRLRLHTDAPLPDPPGFVKAVLVPVDEPRQGIDWEGPSFGPDREIVTTAWRAGRMQVRWIASSKSEGGAGGRVVELGEPVHVEVFEHHAEQVFDLHLSPAQMEVLRKTILRQLAASQD